MSKNCTVLLGLTAAFISTSAYGQSATINPPASAATGGQADSVVLKAGSHAAVMGTLRTVRPMQIEAIRTNSVVRLGNNKLDFAPMLRNPKALFNIAQKMRAVPQNVEVRSDTVELVEVDQGIVVHNFLSYRFKPGACSDVVRRAQVESTGIHCFTQQDAASQAAAFSNPHDAHYVADPVRRSQAIAAAQTNGARIRADIAQRVAKIRGTLNDQARASTLNARFGPGASINLAKMTDDQLALELLNSGQQKVEQVMFVPRQNVTTLSATAGPNGVVAWQKFGATSSPALMDAKANQATQVAINKVAATPPPPGKKNSMLVMGGQMTNTNSQTIATSAILASKAINTQQAQQTNNNVSNHVDCVTTGHNCAPSAGEPESDKPKPPPPVYQDDLPNLNASHPLDEANFLTGFTLGKKYEWKQRVEVTIDWFFDSTTYYVEAYAGFEYGFGLRFPIHTSGIYNFTRQKGKATANVKFDFAAFDGDVGAYQSTGLPNDQLFKGQEIVAELGAFAGLRYDLPLVGSGGIPVQYKEDFTQYLPDQYKGGNFTPPSPGHPNAPVSKFFENIDLLGGSANFGVLGAQVFPGFQVTLHSDDLHFTLVDGLNKGAQPVQIVSGVSTPIAVDANTSQSVVTIKDPVYKLGFNITPGLDARVFVDVGIWGDHWDWPLWFPQIAVDLPPGGKVFACHENTNCSKTYTLTP